MSEWVSAVLTIILNILSVLNITLILQLFFGIGLCSKIWHYGIIGGGFAIFNVIIALFAQKDWVQLGAIFGYIVIIAFVMTKEKRWKSVLFTIPAILLYIQWTSLLALDTRLLHMESYMIQLGDGTITLMNYLSDVLIMIILIVMIYFGKRKHWLVPMTASETVFITLFCIFSPAIIEVFELLEETLNNSTFSLVWMFFMNVLNVAVFYGIFHRRTAKYYIELSENYKQQFDSEYTYFKDYKEQQWDTAKFRHDWNNHMLLLQSMFEQGDYEKAQTYFSQLSMKCGGSHRRILTGNEVVDIILSAKEEELKKAQITVHCNGSLEQLEFMEAVDCCILFSNLVDNAIEANCKCEDKRYIRIQTTRNPGMLIITIENRKNGAVRQVGKRLLTTKEDIGCHGIGTQNAFEIVRKYQGEYQILTEEESFAIQMMFPLS